MEHICRNARLLEKKAQDIVTSMHTLHEISPLHPACLSDLTHFCIQQIAPRIGYLGQHIPLSTVYMLGEKPALTTFVNKNV